MRAMWNRVSLGWCRLFHPEPSWPVHGHYRCLVCSQVFPVPWSEGEDFLRRESSQTAPAGGRPDFVQLEFQKDRV